MTPADIVAVHALIAQSWPPRLVDPLTKDSARAVAAMMPEDATLDHGLAVVREFFKAGSPFPPSWPEIAQRWQAHAAGVADDPALIANAWLAEVSDAVHRVGVYRRPEWSDPIIPAAIDQACGGWTEWCMTPIGGVAAEGEPFVRNLAPERDERFRRAAAAMIKHRRQTGDQLPQIVAGRRRSGLTAGEFRKAIEAKVEAFDDA